MRVGARPRLPSGAELQEVVALILAEYRRFLLGGETEDGAAKAFGTRHTADRAALAHLELALKLAGGGAESEDAARRVSDGIAEWRARMSTTTAPQEEPEAHDHDGSGA